MKQIIKYREPGGLRLVGKYTLRAFDRGVIGKLMADGLALDEAVETATRAGSCRQVKVRKNIIVTVGKQLVGHFLIGTAVTGLTYHAIGTGTTTPSVSDTILTTEAGRIAIMLRNMVGITANLSSYYLASQCTFNIKEVGIFGNDASATPGSGTLFSHSLMSYDNSAGTHDLTFEYLCEIQEG